MDYFCSCALVILIMLQIFFCIAAPINPIIVQSITTRMNQNIVGFSATPQYAYTFKQSCNTIDYSQADCIYQRRFNIWQQTTFQFVSKNWRLIKIAKISSASNNIVGSINSNNQLIFYQITSLNNGLIQKYNTSRTASKLLMDQQTLDYAFALDLNQTQLMIINLRLNMLEKNIAMTSSLHPIQQIVCDGGIIAGYSKTLINNSMPFYFYNSHLNSSTINQLNVPWNLEYTLNSFKVSASSNILVVTSANQVQIWDFQNHTMITNIPNNFSTNSNFTDAVVCNGLIFVFSLKFLKVYELINSALYESIDIIGASMVRMAKCFSNQSKVGVYISISNSAFNNVTYFNFNYTYSIDPTNFTNSTNSTTDNNSSQNVLPNNSQPTIPQSTNHLSANTDQIFNISLHIKTAVMSPESTNVGEITSNVAGLTSATALLKPIMQPFTGFIEDFWFYGFHQFEYPEFVQLFTEEIDILNQLRIKPQFLNLQLQFPDLESANSRQIEVKLLQDKAPESQYMLQATKDIYTVNFATSLVSFAVVKLMCLLLKSIRHSCLVFKKAYFFLSPISKWWSLMIAVFESNITPIVFYASLQFNSFVCFDLFSKFNLMMTLLMFFTFQTYAFVFYPLLFQFGRRKSRKKVSDFGKGRPNSYWLEMCLKCLRSYFQSLVHGLCINGNLIQLLGLIVSDFAFLVAVIRLRKMFSSKAVFLSTALYFVLFLTFDITLIVYRFFRSFQVQGSRRRELEIYFEFVTMLQIVLLLMIMIAKILIPIFSSFWKAIVQRLKRNNEIIDQSALKNTKKSIKFKLKSQKSKNVLIDKQTPGCSKQELQKKTNTDNIVKKSIRKVKGSCEKSRVGMEVKWVGSKTENKKH